VRTGRTLGGRLDKLEIVWQRPPVQLEVEHFEYEGQAWVRLRFPGTGSTGWKAVLREMWEAV
jgi:hypothetical protein